LFHFNSRAGDKVLPDDEGEHLSDQDAARTVAESSAREVLLEAVKSGRVPPDDIEVTDAEGRVVITVSIDDVIKRA
jgi:hypothetical protein